MRLIDSDLLLEELNSFSMRITGSANAMALMVMDETKKSIAKMVDRQPTAYDVDKVIERLEDKALERAINGQQFGEDGYYNSEKEEQCIKQGIEESIEIVKSGGI